MTFTLYMAKKDLHSKRKYKKYKKYKKYRKKLDKSPNFFMVAGAYIN